MNAGNWNWLSSGDPEEIKENLSNFCPVKNARKLDPDGEYIRYFIFLIIISFNFILIYYKSKYCPELKEFTNEYLYEPSKAPLIVQEEADCIIGKDYPEPCLDHVEACKENIAKLQQYFLTEKKDIFEIFRNEKNVIKPTNSIEYKNFTYAKLLESEFEDF